MADAQSIPGLVEVHDDVALTGSLAMTVPTEQDLIGFVVHEARLIDGERALPVFDEWLTSDDAGTRLMAIRGMGSCGPAAAPKLPLGCAKAGVLVITRLAITESTSSAIAW